MQSGCLSTACFLAVTAGLMQNSSEQSQQFNSVAKLTECDREQIQFIDHIQPMGALFACDEKGIIKFAALGTEFKENTNDLIGKHLEQFIGSDATRIFAAVEERIEPTTPILFRSKRSNRWLTCIGHKQNDNRIFELEFSSTKPVEIPSVKFMKERRETLASYLAYITENIQAVTGYDRVMIYKFAPDWHGEVVAESLNANANSFYGHHFPASDIPVPARNLFTQLWVRMIADVDAIPVAIMGFSKEKLDLSKSVLRAASPIHIEYLRNMGVAASLTLSLICDGKLWGLIACHHFSPRQLSSEERSVCSLLAKLISSRITAFSVGASIAASKQISEFTIDFEKTVAEGKLIECAREHKHSLLKFVACDGFAVVAPSHIVADSPTPDPDQLMKIVDALNSSGAEVMHTSELASMLPVLKGLESVAAGVLAFKLNSNWFIWTRKEIVRSILWAGDPQKTLPENDSNSRISPRLSFEAWREEVRGKSLQWEEYEVHAVERLRQTLIRVEEGKVREETDLYLYQKGLDASIRADAASLQQQFKNLNLSDLDNA
jgi:chemotaxis family two-component system sensor kinase Cph1